MAVAPPIISYLLNRQAQTDWSTIKIAIVLYAALFFIYGCLHLYRTPVRLDEDREQAENMLHQIIAEHEAAIGALTAKPTRTPAEQNDYDTATKALNQFGQKAEIALRHLRRQGKLTFGTFPPSLLPPGLNANDAEWAYNACAGEGLVVRRDDRRTGDKTFEISPRMEKILDELLYPEPH